jgi:hypothetical protein
MARRGGSRNAFLKQGIDLREHVVHQYGPLMPLVEKMQHAHLTSKKGCHQCAKDVQDRIYGKVPVTVRHTGSRDRLILISGGIGTLENLNPPSGYLEEGAAEGEFEEEDDEESPAET